LNQPLPKGAKIKPYWRDCLTDLHTAYDGICAYLCVFVERVTGGASVDHFIAKSNIANLAYEWSNYRLACSTMNSHKRELNDVLDPFTLTPNSDFFHLELLTGKIYPNPKLPNNDLDAVKDSIKRLHLDDGGCRELRARWFQEYLTKEITEAYLRKRSPFVWYEAKRQKLI
jgi:uncharacterized protein (TIGR02646 family)